ncbi:hypothetical protein [uncultured Anaerovibrio sp.]|uniref:hypothetical protein n=1 Tax=uncultured Anaerovibrio sp. TaxID=361586 RepID=UPI0025D81DD8|nr:hypothetical protein [uncultured Anaerovibrio sp.]
MLIGHLGALLSFVTFFISVMAYSYGKDAYEIEPFERNCFFVLLGCTVINIAALLLKDYSVLYYADYLQFVASVGVFLMFAGLCWVFYQIKYSRGR